MSHLKPWNDATFRLDLVPYFETGTIPELDVVCEQRARVVKHAKSLTRQPEGNQITQVGIFSTTPTKYIHNIPNDGSSMTFAGRRDVSSTL
jgi:hypothetical protein